MTAAYSVDDTGDGYYDDSDARVVNDEVTGTNTLPTVSEPMQSTDNSDYGKTIGQVLGSAVSTARDVGTIVGTVRRTGSDAQKTYTTAQANAASGNKVGQFWQYATPTEKAMIVLAVVAIVVTLRK